MQIFTSVVWSSAFYNMEVFYHNYENMTMITELIVPWIGIIWRSFFVVADSYTSVYIYRITLSFASVWFEAVTLSSQLAWADNMSKTSQIFNKRQHLGILWTYLESPCEIHSNISTNMHGVGWLIREHFINLRKQKYFLLRNAIAHVLKC